MMDRPRLIASTASAMVFALLLAGCGSYDNISKGATGGGTSSGGKSGAGTGGSSGAATGGATSSGGQAGSSSGGAAMAGSGAGGAAGAGAGGAPGGGGGQAACSSAAPCGGDVVGTWKAAGCPIAVSGNADLSTTGLGCTTAPVTGSISVTGTLTVTADGKFTDATTTAGSAMIELAQPCLKISGFGTTCDRINLENLGLNTVTCVDNTATQGCTCTATISQFGGMSAISIEGSLNGPDGWKGTYTAANNKVVTTAEAGVTSEYSYCVAGNALNMSLASATMLGTLTGPIAFEKK